MEKIIGINMKPKKILIFSHIYFPWIGGAEIAIQEITSRLKDTEFVLVTGKRDKKLAKTEKKGNVCIERIGIGQFFVDQYLYPFLAPFKAYNLHKKYNFDIAWAMMPSQAGMAALFFKLFFPSYLDYVLTDQSGDSDMFWKIRTFFWKPLFKMIYKQAVKVQVISQFLEKRALEMGAEKEKIFVIPNGIDVRKFSQTFSDEEKLKARQSLEIDDKDKIIITTSRLVYKNAVDVLILSFKYLVETYKHLNLKLVIVGSGNQESKLKKIADELNIKNNIIFIGELSNDKIPLYLAMSDVYCRPSRSEGQGISFLEAMCAGLPVVTTPVGGIVDFIKEGETGLLADVDNPKSLADKIYALLIDSKLREKIISNSKKMIVEKYDWDKIVNKFEELFDV